VVSAPTVHSTHTSNIKLVAVRFALNYLQSIFDNMFIFIIDQLVAELSKGEYNELIASLEDCLFPDGLVPIVDWDQNVINILFTIREWLFTFDPEFPLTIKCSPIQMGLDDVMKLEYSPLRNLLFHIRKFYGELFDDKSNFIYRCKYEHGRVHLTHRWLPHKIAADETCETTPRKSPGKRKRERIIDENAMHADDVKECMCKQLFREKEFDQLEMSFRPISPKPAATHLVHVLRNPTAKSV